MTPKEIKALIKTLRAAGVTHYKTPELELNLGPAVSRETLKKIEPSSTEEPIPHVVKELSSLLKLSDQDLVDRLFPDHTNEQGAEESANEQN